MVKEEEQCHGRFLVENNVGECCLFVGVEFHCHSDTVDGVGQCGLDVGQK